MLSDSRICPLCGGKRLKYNKNKELVCQDYAYNYEPEQMKKELDILRGLAFATTKT